MIDELKSEVNEIIDNKDELPREIKNQLKNLIEEYKDIDEKVTNELLSVTALIEIKEGKIITILEYTYGVLKRQEAVNRVDKQGQKQGSWKDFYEDGKVKAERTFVNGKKSGYEKTYAPTGSLANIEKYVGDSLQKEAPELTTKLEVRNEYYEDGREKRTWKYKGVYK